MDIFIQVINDTLLQLFSFCFSFFFSFFLFFFVLLLLFLSYFFFYSTWLLFLDLLSLDDSLRYKSHPFVSSGIAN